MKHKIALLGLGTVGLGTYQLIEKNSKTILENTGAEVEVKYALVKNAAKSRPVPAEVITTDFDKIVNDPEIELVICLTTPAALPAGYRSVGDWSRKEESALI